MPILEIQPPTREDVATAAKHWRELAKQVLAMGEWEVSRGIWPDVIFFQRQHDLYIEIAAGLEVSLALGPQEPPDNPMIFNRRQPDGSYRDIKEFFLRPVGA